MKIKDLFTTLEVDEKTQLYILITVGYEKSTSNKLFTYSQFQDKLLEYPQLNSCWIEKILYSQSRIRDENTQTLNLLLVDVGEDNFLRTLK